VSVVQIARCPEHGLPEERDDCHAVCKELPCKPERPLVEVVCVHRDDVALAERQEADRA